MQVKIGTDLYKTILPMVKQQVESQVNRRSLFFRHPIPLLAQFLIRSVVVLSAPQIKVRDMSAAKITIQPADHTSWSDVRTELIAEKKAALRSELETELVALSDEGDIEKLRTSFSARLTPSWLRFLE